MVVIRHESREGSPAYLTYWKRSPTGVWEFLRLVYASAPGFEQAWEGAIDGPLEVLDTTA